MTNDPRALGDRKPGPVGRIAAALPWAVVLTGAAALAGMLVIVALLPWTHRHEPASLPPPRPALIAEAPAATGTPTPTVSAATSRPPAPTRKATPAPGRHTSRPARTRPPTTAPANRSTGCSVVVVNGVTRSSCNAGDCTVRQTAGGVSVSCSSNAGSGRTRRRD